MISILEIVKNLLLALTAYLNLKAKTYCIDLHEKSYEKQDKYVQQIQALAQNPNPNNVERIGVLQLRLQQERKRLADLSTHCS